MKYLVVLLVALGIITASFAQDGFPDENIQEYKDDSSMSNHSMDIDSVVTISAVGQGVAPSFATSPAQSYALAKRAATADAYRLIAERVKGVRIDGKDTIKNMAIKSSSVNTRVAAMIRNAKVVETTFKDGLCEVELEIDIDKNNFK